MITIFTRALLAAAAATVGMAIAGQSGSPPKPIEELPPEQEVGHFVTSEDKISPVVTAQLPALTRSQRPSQTPQIAQQRESHGYDEK